MSDGEQAGDTGILQMAEIELRRYEARLGVWKVVLGTLIVGLAGIIIPAAINMTTLLFEDWRAQARFKLEKQQAHQQYIKDFFDTAVNQDIELRIRFAHYFESLSDAEQKELWASYLTELTGQRETIRNRINDLEGQLVRLQKAELTEGNVIKLDLVSRQLNWAYSEIGYVPLDRSTVQVVPGKKERLYQETIDVIDRLVRDGAKIDKNGADYKRFWELHDRDLIGVESRTVARQMIAFGRRLRQVADVGGAVDRLLIASAEGVKYEIRSELQGPGWPETSEWGGSSERDIQQQSAPPPVSLD